MSDQSYVHDVSARLTAELERTGHGGNPDELLDLYTLLVLTTGTRTTLADVHDAWALWRMRTRPGHPDLIPFDELADEVKAWDVPYRDAIRAVAVGLRLDPDNTSRGA